MKITKNHLRKIIKEEISKVLNENENIAVTLNGMSDDEVIAFMNMMESEEEQHRAGHRLRHMKYPFAEKEAWFKEEGWKRWNAGIWIAHGGYSDPPMMVDEEEFQEELQDNFNAQKPQSYEEGVEIFNNLYDNMERAAAGRDI